MPGHTPTRLQSEPASFERDVVADDGTVEVFHRLIEDSRPLVPGDRPALLPVTHLNKSKLSVPRRQGVFSAPPGKFSGLGVDGYGVIGPSLTEPTQEVLRCLHIIHKMKLDRREVVSSLVTHAVVVSLGDHFHSVYGLYARVDVRGFFQKSLRDVGQISCASVVVLIESL